MAPTLNQASGALCLLAFLASCGAGDGLTGEVPAASQKLFQVERSPLFIAKFENGDGSSSAPTVADAAVRFARGVSPDDRGVGRLEVAAAPILFGSPEGQEFLLAPGARAFAIGTPPAACPARASGVGSTAVAAAEASLDGCFKRMEEARPEGGRDCGCLLVALGDFIIAPPETLSYANGVSTRVVAPDFGEDRYLVAEELAGEDGDRLLAFRAAGPPASGPLAAVIRRNGATQVLWRDPETADEAIALIGRRVGDGLRRGRYAERLYVEDARGRRMILLIGYEPVEYALKRRELLTWPLG